jgi:hypothetical protein
MKKAEYQKPQVEVIEISVSNMLASSIYIDDKEENIVGRVQKRREDCWGNLWKEDTKR